jgi:hypothetical protein
VEEFIKRKAVVKQLPQATQANWLGAFHGLRHVQHSGGHILVQSETGRGTAFHIYFLGRVPVIEPVQATDLRAHASRTRLPSYTTALAANLHAAKTARILRISRIMTRKDNPSLVLNPIAGIAQPANDALPTTNTMTA